jgi:hypothetical protein
MIAPKILQKSEEGSGGIGFGMVSHLETEKAA